MARKSKDSDIEEIFEENWINQTPEDFERMWSKKKASTQCGKKSLRRSNMKEKDILKSMGITVSEESANLLEEAVPAFINKSDYETSDGRMGLPGNPRERLEEGLYKGYYGSTEDARTQKVVMPAKDKQPVSDEWLKNTHAEEWHSDNDKLVEEFVTSAEEIDVHERGEHPKSLRVTDKRNRKVAQITEAEKSLSTEELFIKGSFPALSAKPSMVAKKPAKDDEQKKQEKQQRDESEVVRSLDVLIDLAKGDLKKKVDLVKAKYIRKIGTGKQAKYVYKEAQGKKKTPEEHKRESDAYAKNSREKEAVEIKQLAEKHNLKAGQMLTPTWEIYSINTDPTKVGLHDSPGVVVHNIHEGMVANETLSNLRSDRLKQLFKDIEADDRRKRRAKKKFDEDYKKYKETKKSDPLDEVYDLIKAAGHKYVKRTGSPGNYKYWYRMPDGSLKAGDESGGPKGAKASPERGAKRKAAVEKMGSKLKQGIARQKGDKQAARSAASKQAGKKEGEPKKDRAADLKGEIAKKKAVETHTKRKEKAEKKEKATKEAGSNGQKMAIQHLEQNGAWNVAEKLKSGKMDKDAVADWAEDQNFHGVAAMLRADEGTDVQVLGHAETSHGDLDGVGQNPRSEAYEGERDGALAAKYEATDPDGRIHGKAMPIDNRGAHRKIEAMIYMEHHGLRGEGYKRIAKELKSGDRHTVGDSLQNKMNSLDRAEARAKEGHERLKSNPYVGTPKKQLDKMLDAEFKKRSGGRTEIDKLHDASHGHEGFDNDLKNINASRALVDRVSKMVGVKPKPRSESNLRSLVRNARPGFGPNAGKPEDVSHSDGKVNYVNDKIEHKHSGGTDTYGFDGGGKATFYSRSKGGKVIRRSYSPIDEVHDLVKSKFDFDKNKKLDTHEKMHRDEEKLHTKVKKIVKEEESEKSTLDQLCDLVKGGPGSGKKKGGGKSDPYANARKQLGEKYPGMYTPEVLEHMRQKDKRHDKNVKRKDGYHKKSFIKSSGPGGVIMDFGHVTGNPIADRGTLLLNQNYDPQQNQIAKGQKEAYEKALTGYVEKGVEQQVPGMVDGEWNRQLNTPIDEQMKKAHEAGALDTNPNQTMANSNHQQMFDKSKFAQTQINVGGEVVKATSETDIAMINMMKGTPNLNPNSNAIVADCTGGGVQGGLADLTTGILTDRNGQQFQKADPTPPSEASGNDTTIFTADSL